MKFKLYREKTLLGRYDHLTIANLKAREDALKESSYHREPTYVIAGNFGGGERTRIGKLSHGRVRWKFADLIRAKRKKRNSN
jgi:hypothetical protein